MLQAFLKKEAILRRSKKPIELHECKLFPISSIPFRYRLDIFVEPLGIFIDKTLPIRLTPMTATCRVPPLSRVKLGIGWSRGVARDAEQ